MMRFFDHSFDFVAFGMPLLGGYFAYDSENACYLPVDKSKNGLLEVTISENDSGTVVVSYTGTKVQQIVK